MLVLIGLLIGLLIGGHYYRWCDAALTSYLGGIWRGDPWIQDFPREFTGIRMFSIYTVASMLPCGRYYYEPEGGYVGNP